MDDQTSDNSYEPLQNDSSAYSQPRRYHRPHISQDPIDDAEPEYVTRNRYQTLEEAQSGRRHMESPRAIRCISKMPPYPKTAHAARSKHKHPPSNIAEGPVPSKL